MMLAPALAAERVLAAHGAGVTVVNVPVIKPIDAAGVRDAARGRRAVVTAENHLVTGGLGSAVAEVLAEAGGSPPLRRVGLRDTFAEGAASAPYLFEKYGLSTRHLVEVLWSALGREGAAPGVPRSAPAAGEYSPV
jgi:transketolase